MLDALSAGWPWAVICAAFCAFSAFCAWRAFTAAKKLRSMTSLAAELIEIRDYMARIETWAKKIQMRETTRERRQRESAASLTPVSTLSDKDELRRRAGLVAGQPARHREAS